MLNETTDIENIKKTKFDDFVKDGNVNLSIYLWLWTKKIDNAKKVFHKFLSEKRLKICYLKNINYKIRESSSGKYMQVEFEIPINAKDENECVISSMKMMEFFHIGGHSFYGYFYDKFNIDITLISQGNVSGANGGIQTVCIQLKNPFNC